MNKPLRLPDFWWLASVQILLVVAGSVIWYYFRTEAYLAGPPDPDTYAWNWGFQIIAFAFFWLPSILVCTGILLAIQRIVLIPFYRPHCISSSDHGS